jgi:signal transduction histidine kinase
LESKAQSDIVILIVVGCLAMLMLVAFIILFVLYYQKKVLSQQYQMQAAENKYQRELLSAVIQVEEKERDRIAKNIHDDVGTLLNVLKLNLSKIERNAKDEVLTEKLSKENLSLLEESIQGIRGIAKDLVPPTLVKLGYIKAIHELCKHINNSGQITVTFLQNELDTHFPQQTKLQLYRLTQELLNNIIKHAGAKEIIIELTQINARFNLIISHNGKGITSEQVKELSKKESGLGLKSIQSRAQLISANVIYNAPADAFASVSVEFVS